MHCQYTKNQNNACFSHYFMVKLFKNAFPMSFPHILIFINNEYYSFIGVISPATLSRKKARMRSGVYPLPSAHISLVTAASVVMS